MKIMVVDDEKGICDFMSDFFERRGHDVICVTDPTKAVAVMEKENPPIILLDKIMQKMDGFKVLEAMRKVNKKNKIIVVTVSDEPGVKKEALKLGASDFINKPFSMDYLESVVMAKIQELVK